MKSINFVQSVEAFFGRSCSSFPSGSAVTNAGPVCLDVPVGTEEEEQAECQAARRSLGMFSKAAGSGCPDALQQTEQQGLTQEGLFSSF